MWRYGLGLFYSFHLLIEDQLLPLYPTKGLVQLKGSTFPNLHFPCFARFQDRYAELISKIGAE